jgi:hypothetical protein
MSLSRSINIRCVDYNTKFHSYTHLKFIMPVCDMDLRQNIRYENKVAACMETPKFGTYYLISKLQNRLLSKYNNSNNNKNSKSIYN